MIYISSTCAPKEKIGDVVEDLARHGFRNIELTAGSEYYDKLELDLLYLKEKYGLTYICHHYFPPPKDSFVVNLASLDDRIYYRSLLQLQRSLRLSKRIGAEKCGLHAGFFVDVQSRELGGIFGYREVNDRRLALRRFCEGYRKLQDEADGIQLYVENNVYSYSNFKTYGENAPFMLLHAADYMELKDMIDFNLLLDIGHLMVTITTLNLRGDEEFGVLINSSDYIHISENDGLHDQHRGLSGKGPIRSLLENYDLEKKTVTLEIYKDMAAIQKSYEILSQYIRG